MKIPKPTQLAQIKGFARRTNNGRVEKEIEYSDSVRTNILPGDASVASTRSLKHWYSTRDAGISVEAAATVTVSCERDPDSILHAGKYTGDLAHKLVTEGCNEMDVHIEEFIRTAKPSE